MLQFTIPPDQISVWAWSVREGVEQEPVEVDTWLGGEFAVPELDGAAVFEVRGGWYLVGDNWGEVSYFVSIA